MPCTSHEEIRNTTDRNNHLSNPNGIRYSRLNLGVPQRPFKSCAKKRNPSQLCPEDLQFLVTERQATAASILSWCSMCYPRFLPRESGICEERTLQDMRSLT